MSEPTREPLSGEWCAYAQEGILDESGKHVVAYVEKDEPGYYSTTYVGDLEYVKSVAASINKSKGLSQEQVDAIVASSFAASNRAHA